MHSPKKYKLQTIRHVMRKECFKNRNSRHKGKRQKSAKCVLRKGKNQVWLQYVYGRHGEKALQERT